MTQRVPSHITNAVRFWPALSRGHQKLLAFTLMATGSAVLLTGVACEAVQKIKAGMNSPRVIAKCQDAKFVRQLLCGQDGLAGATYPIPDFSVQNLNSAQDSKTKISYKINGIEMPPKEVDAHAAMHAWDIYASKQACNVQPPKGLRGLFVRGLAKAFQ